MAPQKNHHRIDPDIAIIYIPDASGKFMFRCFVRLCTFNNTFCLLFYKGYGNANINAIYKRMAKEIPAYIAEARLGVMGNHYYLTSATKLTTLDLGSPVWCDHVIMTTKDKHIEMIGIPVQA